jgi:hypothetical protein
MVKGCETPATRGRRSTATPRVHDDAEEVRAQRDKSSASIEFEAPVGHMARAAALGAGQLAFRALRVGTSHDALVMVGPGTE